MAESTVAGAAPEHDREIEKRDRRREARTLESPCAPLVHRLSRDLELLADDLAQELRRLDNCLLVADHPVFLDGAQRTLWVCGHLGEERSRATRSDQSPSGFSRGRA